MKKREVGQTLYILSQNDMNLIPVLVVEEIIKRTIESEEITYAVEALGKNGAKKRFPLNSTSMIIFDEIDQAREYLVKNATEAINSMCLDALERASLLASKSYQKSQNNDFLEKSDHGYVQKYESVILEDGTKVKINIPTGE